MRKKHKHKHNITITYPASVMASYDRIVKRAMGRSDASGAGFGERDHSWYGLGTIAHYNRLKKLHSLGRRLPKMRITTWTD